MLLLYIYLIFFCIVMVLIPTQKVWPMSNLTLHLAYPPLITLNWSSLGKNLLQSQGMNKMRWPLYERVGHFLSKSMLTFKLRHFLIHPLVHRPLHSPTYLCIFPNLGGWWDYPSKNLCWTISTHLVLSYLGLTPQSQKFITSINNLAGFTFFTLR